MAIRKQSLKSKPVCKVTFKIPEEMANAATQANMVGEFNNWSDLGNAHAKIEKRRFQRHR